MTKTREFEGTDLAALKAYIEQEQASSSLFRMKEEGTKTLRLLPQAPVEGRVKFFFEKYGVHYDIPLIARNAPSDRTFCACLKDTLRQDCPLCKAVFGIYAAARMGGKEDKATILVANKARAKLRYACNIIDMDTPQKGVQIWSYPSDTQEKILPLFDKFGALDRDDYGTDKPEGDAIEFKFKKQGRWLNVESAIPSMKHAPIPVDGWKEKRHDLDAWIEKIVVGQDEMKSWIVGGVSDIVRNAKQMLEEVEQSNGDGQVRSREQTPPSLDALQDPEIQRLLQRAGKTTPKTVE